MPLSHKVVAAALAALVFGGITASGQNQTPPADTAALLAEVKALRADIGQAAGASMRMQLLIARVSLQEQRIAAVARQLADAQDQLTAAAHQRTEAQARFTDVSGAIETMRSQGKDTAEFEGQLGVFKRQLAEATQAEQQTQLHATEMQNLLTDEQGRWTDFNNRLDELERSLPPR